MTCMPICNIEDASLDYEFDHKPNFYHKLAILEPKNALTSLTKMAIAIVRITRMTSKGS